MCRAAFEKGLAAIGFSSHAPLENALPQTEWHMKNGRLGEYATVVRAARQRWEGKIPVYLGLETDYIKGLRSPQDKDLLDLGLDYQIGSVHYVFAEGGVVELDESAKESFNGNGEALMNAYWDAMLEMIHLGDFDIVAHLDYIRKINNTKENQCRLFDTESEIYARRSEEVVQAIAASDLVVELSTGGINRGHNTGTFPSPALLRLLCRNKVPVMISADAHRTDHLDGHYPLASQIMFDAGYRSHVVFEGRNGVSAKDKGTPILREQKL
jgi:histidinol-phosphatase (PHP family)